MTRKFSHVANFTGYMQVVFDLITVKKEKQKILDIPAGNGLLAEKLRSSGHDVVAADINREKPDFVYADMSEQLPFANNTFDTVTCLEGLEHLIQPSSLVSELCRVCKPGGRIIISLPNIQNMYSRFQFMCTGTFYQFPPILPSPQVKQEKVDLGHISSLSYTQLRYLFQYFGARVIHVSGDKYKRKLLLPILLPFIGIGYLWSKTTKHQDSMKEAFFFKKELLFSRSLIIVFEKE